MKMCLITGAQMIMWHQHNLNRSHKFLAAGNIHAYFRILQKIIKERAPHGVGLRLPGWVGRALPPPHEELQLPMQAGTVLG